MTGCNRDGCTDPEAENYDSNASNDDDSCILPRDGFLGIYSVQESCEDTGTDSYEFVISASADNSTDVLITNFFGVGAMITASVDGNNITIGSQSGGTSAAFSGSGSLAGNTLNLQFEVNDVTNDTCTITATKQ